MIRVFILISFLFILSFSARAQFAWMKKKPVPVALRYPDLPAANFAANFGPGIALNQPEITADLTFARTQYDYDVNEAALMKSLYHTLRFHMYLESITTFHILIGLYSEQNRYAEAKWYWLQCTNLAQQNNDQSEIIASLVGISIVKAELGEFDQAHDDLVQAHELASNLGRFNDMMAIDKKIALLKTKQLSNVKNESRYAELVDDKKNAQ